LQQLVAFTAALYQALSVQDPKMPSGIADKTFFHELGCGQTDGLSAHPQGLGHAFVRLVHVQLFLSVQNHQDHAAQLLLQRMVLTAHIAMGHLCNQCPRVQHDQALRDLILLKTSKDYIQFDANAVACSLHNGLVVAMHGPHQQVQAHQALFAHHRDFDAFARGQ
jgi:hypothetical protein